MQVVVSDESIFRCLYELLSRQAGRQMSLVLFRTSMNMEVLTRQNCAGTTEVNALYLRLSCWSCSKDASSVGIVPFKDAL